MAATINWDAKRANLRQNLDSREGITIAVMPAAPPGRDDRLRRSVVLLAALAIGLAACGSGLDLLPRVDPPPGSEAAEIGAPFPFSMWETVSDPHEVPGIVTLVDPDTATFRADADASELPLSGFAEEPQVDFGCL